MFVDVMRWSWIGWWLPMVACVSRGEAESSEASSEAGDTMPLPSDRCTAAPPAAHGSTIDLAGWSPPLLDENSQGDWEGGCTVMDVQAASTTLDCSADPSGPPSIGLSFALASSDPPWQPGDAVDVAYFQDGWSDGEYLSLRSADGDLLLALAYGGGDGGHTYLGPFIAPLTFDEHAEYCGDASDPGEILPFRVTFVGLDGEAHHLLQGEETIAGPRGNRYAIELYQAEIGDLSSNHYGRFIDLVVQRLP